MSSALEEAAKRAPQGSWAACDDRYLAELEEAHKAGRIGIGTAVALAYSRGFERCRRGEDWRP